MSSLSFSSLPISPELLPPRFSFKTVSAMIALVVFGAMNVIIFKLQTTQFKLSNNSFQIQVFFVFAGQYLNILFFYLRLRFRRNALISHFKNAQRKALFQAKAYKFGRTRIFWASLLHFIAVFLQLRILTYLSPLLFQMFLSFGAIFMPIISRLILGKRIYFHTGIGMLFLFIGFIAMFVTAYIFAYEDIKFDGSLVYTVLWLTISLLADSGRSLYEEWLNDQIVISSFRFAGLEGIFGIILLTIVAIGCQGYSVWAEVPFYSMGFDVWSILKDKLLIYSSAVLIVSNSLYGLSSITLTKKLSATFKMMTDILKVILVWLGQFAFFDMEHPDWDKKKYITFTCLRLLSYSFMIFGNILINEIYELTCCGLSRYWGRYSTTKMNQNLDESEEYSIIKF